MEEAIELRLGPSRALAVALSLAHSMAMVALWRALPAMLAVPMSVVVMWSAADTLRRHALRTSADAVVGLVARGRGVRIWRRDGQVIEGLVHPESVVLPWLVIVRLHGPGPSVPAVVVTRDSATPAGHRRLRVVMRWGQRDAAGAQPMPWR